jgi:hypothetical protein
MVAEPVNHILVQPDRDSRFSFWDCHYRPTLGFRKIIHVSFASSYLRRSDAVAFRAEIRRHVFSAPSVNNYEHPSQAIEPHRYPAFLFVGIGVAHGQRSPEDAWDGMAADVRFRAGRKPGGRAEALTPQHCTASSLILVARRTIGNSLIFKNRNCVDVCTIVTPKKRI